ncbi:PREDICTED: uncharacterized protein LOC109232363 [Nicotiana attenuata]|uniref:uncharacterized protein LOC109232363 n=1 Tax=Nicotiana attenuata TaxID=49451 RepID=UPI000904F58F|nr:PREDICTED: uncharacterized protein LOC109232363 [Nicotiana attenuata]
MNDHPQGNYMTKDQYKHLVSLLTKSSMEGSSSKTSSSTNMTGIKSLLSNARLYDWIVHSGASHHITICKEVLEKLKRINKGNSRGVQILTGGRSEIVNTGDTTILGGQKIRNVLHVPDFKFNLISVSMLTRDLCCSACFYPRFCVFQGLYNGREPGIGREDEGLYIIRSEEDEIVAGSVKKEVISAELWHQRMGHASIGSLQCFPDLKNKVNKDVQMYCEICPLAKQMLNGKSPYEKLYGKTQKIDHLRVFGCPCYASTLPRGDKFAARALKSVFVDYSEPENLFIPDTDLPTITKDRSISTPIADDDLGIAIKAETDTSTPYVAPDMPLNETTNDMEVPNSDERNEESASQQQEHEQVEQQEHEEELLGQVPSIVQQPTEIIKSTRTPRPAVWLKDCVTTCKPKGDCLYSVSDYVSYDHLLEHYQCYLSSFLAQVEPKSFHEATQDDRWIEAMKQEILALEENKAWEIVDLPPGKQTISSKWVYKIKHKANGEV